MNFGGGTLVLSAALWLGTLPWYIQHNSDRTTISKHVLEFWPCTSEISKNQNVIAQLVNWELDFYQEFTNSDWKIQKYTFPQSTLPLSDKYVPYKKSVKTILDEIEDGWCAGKKEDS